MQRRLRSISAKAVSVILNYLTYFSSILDSTMGPLYSRGEFRTIILYYRRGYPTALQAAEAAGFIQNGLELEKQTDTIESYTILDSQIFNAIQIDKDKYGVWSECYIVFD